MRLRVLALICALASGVVGNAFAGDPKPPTAKDRCSVCGMFVAKYPPWVATVVFNDGTQVFFDGPKDLFRYLLNLEDYDAADREISEVFVKDYYSTAVIDAKDAFFVVGSDVMGPMGPELVPIAKESHAKTFVTDHGGESILCFDEITRDKIPQ